MSIAQWQLLSVKILENSKYARTHKMLQFRWAIDAILLRVRRPSAMPASNMTGRAPAGPNDTLIEKLKSDMQEVRARGGQLFVFADVDSRITSGDGVHVIRMPEHYGQLSPILHVVALQLLAYHSALARGTDVDKPRNLAKSVTVE
jgi:hypothetical protein